MGLVKLYDSVDLKPVGISDEVKDFYSQSLNNGQPVQPLRVRIAATHSGKVTRNNGFYLPHKMKEGVSSFTKHYPKPIQVHHEEKADPIGRAIVANYVDTSTAIRDSFKARNVKTVKDSLKEISYIFDNFVKGTLTKREIIDVANRYFIQDSNLSDDPDYEGLGYIELTALITDPGAIQRLLDGRYMTGSVGASTNQAVCSVCKQDWAGEDGQCDHKPGKVYDSVRCVLIAGDLNYEEYSFVNKPADRHSRVIEVIHSNGVKDYVQLDTVDDVPEISLVSDNSKEDRCMDPKDDTTEKPAEVVTAPADATVETVKDEVSILKDFYGDKFDEVVGDDDPWGVEYAKMMYGLVEEASPETKEAVATEIRDKVLKAAERKKLSGKTFCGPDRSYPVPDCTHARAAVRLAPHAANPSAIVACAKRKAARLGCPFKDEVESVSSDVYSASDVATEGKYDLAFFDRHSNKQLLKMRIGIDKALKERKVLCTSCQEIAKTVDAAIGTSSEEKKLLDAARLENHALHLDIETLNRSVADTISELRQLQYQQIIDYKLLGKETVDKEAVVAELKDKTGPELKTMIKELGDKIDIIKIVDTLNSGIARKPEGTVDDPTTGATAQEIEDGTVVKEDPVEAKQYKFVDEATQKAIRLQYFNIRKTQGAAVADKYIEDFVEKGLLPTNWLVKG